MIVKRKGFVNTVFGNEIARTLIERSNEEHLKCIDLEHSF